ncbi:hypothetical protein QOT17_006708 [Balamuthia mandrillaris]
MFRKRLFDEQAFEAVRNEMEAERWGGGQWVRWMVPVLLLIALAGFLVEGAEPSSTPEQNASILAVQPNATYNGRCAKSCTELRRRKPGEPLKVTVGAYITGLSNLNVMETFWMKGVYWMYWETCASLAPIGSGAPISSSVSSVVLKSRITVEEEAKPFFPHDTIRMVNEWPSRNEHKEPKCDARDPVNGRVMCPVCDHPRPGYSYAAYYFQSHLSTDFVYTNFPLDSQECLLRLGDQNLNADEVELILDPDSKVNLDVDLIGWTVEHTIRRAVHSKRTTNFGTLPALHPSALTNKNKADVFTVVEVGVSVVRHARFFMFKILPPALITLAVSVLVLFLEPEEVGTRLGVALTGLLTEVLLGISFDDKLPDIGYITVTDMLFNWCYALLFLEVLECILMSVWVNRRRKRPVHTYFGVVGKWFVCCCGSMRNRFRRLKAKHMYRRTNADLSNNNIEMALLPESGNEENDESKKEMDEAEDVEERKKREEEELVRNRNSTVWVRTTHSAGFMGSFQSARERKEEKMQHRKRKAKLARRFDFFFSVFICLSASIGTTMIVVISVNRS